MGAHKNTFASAFPGMDIMTDKDGLMGETQKVLLRAELTRLECMLAQTLWRKTSARTKSRVAQYTAEFTNRTGQQWADHVHPSLRELALPILNPSIT